MKLFNNLYKIILEEVDRSPRKSKSSEPEMPREVAGEIEGVMRELKGEKETPLPTKEEVEGMIILIRKHLFNASPYFWHVLKSMPIRIVHPDSRVQTAAVDQYRNLYFNPKFIQDILEDHEGKGGTGYDPFTFLVAHEVYHVVNRTFERQQDRNAVLVDSSGNTHSLWNIATDFEMNDQLKWKWNIIPPTIKGEEVGLITDKDGYAVFLDQKYQIRHKSAEMIYAEILKNVPNKNIHSDGEGDSEDGRNRPIRIGDIVKEKGKDIFGEVVDIKNGEAVLKTISKEEAYRKVRSNIEN